MRKTGLIAAVAALLATSYTGFSHPAHADNTDLYVGFGNLAAVGLYTTSGSSEGLFVNSGSGGLIDPREFKFGPDGNLYVAGYFDSAIKEYNGTTGAFIGNLGSGLSNPYDVAFDSSGSLYVSTLGNNAITKIDRTTGAVVQTYSGFNAPTGLQFNAAGSLLVANYSGGNVVALNTATGAVTPFATGFTNPIDLTTGPDGRVYVLDSGTGQIDAVDPIGTWTMFANVSAQYPVNPRQAADSLVYDNGNFYTVISSDNNMGVAAYSSTTGAYVSSFATPDANSSGIAIKSSLSSVPEMNTVLIALLGLAPASLLTRRKRNC